MKNIDQREFYSFEILKVVLSNPRWQEGLDKICSDGREPDVFEMNVLASIKMADVLIRELKN